MSASPQIGRAGTAAALAGFTAAMAALHLMGRVLGAPPLSSASSLAQWLAEREPGTVAMALVRLLALGLGYHVAATTLLAAAGRILGAPRLLAFADAVTLPVFRSTAGRVAGLALSAATITGGALPALHGDRSAASALDAAFPTNDGEPLLERIVLHPTSAGSDVGGGTARIQVEPDLPAPVVPVAAPAPLLHRVVPGDHLWGIAEGALASTWGRPATDAEIVPFWRAVIAANPDVVDPDLIFPGQLVVVPQVPPAPV